MSMNRHYQPEGCVRIAAKDVREGDRVRFEAAGSYTVESVETCAIGVRHHYGDETASSTYYPNELLWIERRDGDRPARAKPITSVNDPRVRGEG